MHTDELTWSLDLALSMLSAAQKSLQYQLHCCATIKKQLGRGS